MSDQRRKTWSDYKIETPPSTAGETWQTICPECSPTRKKSSARVLTVWPRDENWHCNHCGWSGSLRSGQSSSSDSNWWRESDRPRVFAKPTPKPREETEAANVARKSWATIMSERGISADVLKANGIDVHTIWMPQTENEELALAYPYFRRGELVNVKYRSMTKDFRMEKDAERILWRLDKIAVKTIDTVIFAEGENDALALEVAGYMNATSVPNGAPKENTKTLDNHLAYLEDEYTASMLASKRTFIIAVDNDRPGIRLRDELARRLGPERCKLVTWPTGCKDANDVLVKHGTTALRNAIERATPYPLEGVISVRDFRDAMDDVYAHGLPPGPTTGWASLDRMPDGKPLYRPASKLFTTVTGVPGSGKSRWVNALAVNLATLHDTRFAVCSPEYKPTELLTMHLAETFIGKSADVHAPDRMTGDEWNRAMRFIDDHFHFVVPETTSVIEIIEKSKSLIGRFGIRGLIVDPWTEVDLPDDNGSEVKQLRDGLKEFQRFNDRYDLHTWLCAHPTKLPHERGDTETRVVGVYDIAGGAHFANKSDFIVSLWRDRKDILNHVDVHIKKARFAHLGSYGTTTLAFNERTGRYSDLTTRVDADDYEEFV